MATERRSSYGALAPKDDENTGVITCDERARIYANRLKFSRVYAALYAAALAVSLMLLVWVVVESHTQSRKYLQQHLWVFVTADALVTLFVILEILVAVLAQGWRRYCAITANVLDIAVALFCVFVLLLHALGPAFRDEPEGVVGADFEVVSNAEEEEIEEEEIDATVLVLRYAAQISRLYVMVRHFRRQHDMRTREIELSLDSPKREPELSLDSPKTEAHPSLLPRHLDLESLPPAVAPAGTTTDRTARVGALGADGAANRADEPHDAACNDTMRVLAGPSVRFDRLLCTVRIVQ